MDIKAFSIGKELDQPADAIVILLGANDIFAPYLGDDEKSLAKWEADYRTLIDALQERNQPGTMALATLLPSAEDPDGAKNRLVARMNVIVERLAKEKSCVLIPTSRTFWDGLEEGRKRKPDFHVVADSVHPSQHLFMAIAMLKGLGYEAAVKNLEEKDLALLWKETLGPLPAMSWSVKPLVSPQDRLRIESVSVRYFWHPAADADGGTARVAVSCPTGWTAEPASCNAASGTFTLRSSGSWGLDNVFRFEVKQGDAAPFTQEFHVAAPWRICAGFRSRHPWSFPGMASRAAENSPDAELDKGADIASLPDDAGNPIDWRIFFPSVNYPGGDRPGSTDFLSIIVPPGYASGYGARYIRSEKERDVTLALSSPIFAGNIDLIIWVNGARVYSDVLTRKLPREDTAKAHFRKGWNTLFFKSAHTTYQWQQVIDIVPGEGDSLDDLAVSLTKP
jgi:hypothetical protein